MTRVFITVMAVAVAVSFSAPSFAGEEKKEKKGGQVLVYGDETKDKKDEKKPGQMDEPKEQKKDEKGK